VVPAAHVEAPGAPSPPQPPLALRVVSFNIRFGTADDGPHSWHLRRDAAAAAIRRQAPDVVALQEVLRWQFDELLSLLGAPYIGVFAGRDDGANGGEACAVLYDPGVLQASETHPPQTYWLSDTPDAPGSVSSAWGNPLPCVATEVRFLHRASRRPLAVVNTHLDHASSDARARGMRLILSCEAARLGGGGGGPADGEPWVLCGCLHDGPDSECVRLASEVLVNTLAAAAGAELDTPTYHGFAGAAAAGGRNAHVDFIFASSSTIGGGKLEVSLAAVDRSVDASGTLPSTHHPVVAHVQWA